MAEADFACDRFAEFAQASTAPRNWRGAKFELVSHLAKFCRTLLRADDGGRHDRTMRDECARHRFL
jgi:hypothetical protein